MFFSDLDRTIIYSTRFIEPPMPFLITNVEYHKERHISHMTVDAYEGLQVLRKRIEFVPVTARTIDEVMRIGFIQQELPTWMICENGKVIYHKGKRLQEWDNLINKRLEQEQKGIYQAINMFQSFVKENEIDYQAINEYGFYFKIDQASETALQSLAEKKDWFRKHGCTLYKNSRKIYLMPSILNKGNAVRFLIQKLQPEKTVGAGDSSMDLSFLKEVMYPVVVQHHSISKCPYPVTSQTGMKAGEQIIQYAMMKLCR